MLNPFLYWSFLINWKNLETEILTEKVNSKNLLFLFVLEQLIKTLPSHICRLRLPLLLLLESHQLLLRRIGPAAQPSYRYAKTKLLFPHFQKYLVRSSFESATNIFHFPRQKKRNSAENSSIIYTHFFCLLPRTSSTYWTNVTQFGPDWFVRCSEDYLIKQINRISFNEAIHQQLR